MKKQILFSWLILSAIPAYNFLFWSEKMGLNALLFALLIIALLWQLYPDSRNVRTVQVLTLGTFLSGIFIVGNNSLFSKCIHILSMLAMSAAWQFPSLRFLLNHLFSSFNNLLAGPLNLYRQWKPSAETPEKPRGLFRLLQRLFWPLLLVGFFYVVYAFANPEFAALSADFWSAIGRIFSFDISLAHFLFVVSGIFIVGGLLLRGKKPHFVDLDAQGKDDVVRARDQDRRRRFGFGALRSEYGTALTSFAFLNLLLLVVNITDLRHVWFSFQPRSAEALKQYVHEGTYILIFSILMAMGIIFYFYRKNLHFYPNKRKLDLLCYGWLVQNAFLCLSVGMRNWHYMHQYALAYKRIGVVIFLLCTLFGLFTMYLKIRNNRSVFFVFQRNGWAVYAILLAASALNWDVLITNYNLNHPMADGKIDFEFLLESVSDKNLYLIDQHKNRLDAAPALYSSTFNLHLNPRALQAQRVELFKKEQAGYSWLSWNYPDWVNGKYFQTQSTQ